MTMQRTEARENVAGVPAVGSTAVTVYELVRSIRQQQGLWEGPSDAAGPAVPLRPSNPSLFRRIVVLGAHHGAGATTVATAVADVLTSERTADSADGHVRLLGRGAAVRGVQAGVNFEVAGPAPGWSAGRRGSVLVWWPRSDDAAALPEPVDGTLVIDSGTSNPHTVPEAADALIVVCRATAEGAAAAETYLSSHGPGSALVVVGSKRWSHGISAHLRTRLRELTAAGRVVFVPTSRQLQLGGLDERPLPRATERGARAALALVEPVDLAAPGTRQGKGRL